MNIGFQIDEIDKLNEKTDSSLPLILESQKRKNKNFYFLPIITIFQQRSLNGGNQVSSSLSKNSRGS